VEVNLALDTSAYSEFMRGVPSRLETVRDAAQVFVPLFVLAELRAGFTGGSLGRRNESQLQRSLNEPRVEILLPDEATTHHYAQLYGYLKRLGRPIPANDLWIAALVIQHNLLLCTSDQHFDHLPQIPKC
jgi:predicted nucleic acid-binding protein